MNARFGSRPESREEVRDYAVSEARAAVAWLSPESRRAFLSFDHDWLTAQCLGIADWVWERWEARERTTSVDPERQAWRGRKSGAVRRAAVWPRNLRILRARLLRDEPTAVIARREGVSQRTAQRVIARYAPLWEQRRLDISGRRHEPAVIRTGTSLPEVPDSPYRKIAAAEAAETARRSGGEGAGRPPEPDLHPGMAVLWAAVGVSEADLRRRRDTNRRIRRFRRRYGLPDPGKACKRTPNPGSIPDPDTSGISRRFSGARPPPSRTACTSRDATAAASPRRSG